MPDWSPTQYLKFADERTRPTRDLLAQVALDHSNLIYDLGCGPGNSTELLVAAFPNARIIGVDNSLAMIERAKTTVSGASFQIADLNTWMLDEDADLLFSNATFQWLPRHIALFQSYLARMRSGAVLAVQMPDNVNEPSHTLMRDVAIDKRWQTKLQAVSVARSALPSPQVYYDALRPLCSRLDIWHTIYNHPLDGAGGIVEWVKSTGLRPFLDALTEPEALEFIASYQSRIDEVYPSSPDGKCLLRFPRLFILATK